MFAFIFRFLVNMTACFAVILSSICLAQAQSEANPDGHHGIVVYGNVSNTPGLSQSDGKIYQIYDHIHLLFIADGGQYGWGQKYVNYTADLNLLLQFIIEDDSGQTVYSGSQYILGLSGVDPTDEGVGSELIGQLIEEDADGTSFNYEPPVQQEFDGYLNILDIIGRNTALSQTFKVKWRYVPTFFEFDDTESYLPILNAFGYAGDEKTVWGEWNQVDVDLSDI